MLVVTLLFQTFLNQTAGAQWHIGSAYLGGNNGLGRFSAGITELPSLKLGIGRVVYEFVGTSTAFYYLVFGLAVVTFLGLRVMVNSRIGYIMVAIHEDSDRTEAFGYDVRLIQLPCSASARCSRRYRVSSTSPGGGSSTLRPSESITTFYR